MGKENDKIIVYSIRLNTFLYIYRKRAWDRWGQGL